MVCRLAALLMADVVGYSRLTHADAGTWRRSVGRDMRFFTTFEDLAAAVLGCRSKSAWSTERHSFLLSKRSALRDNALLKHSWSLDSQAAITQKFRSVGRWPLNGLGGRALGNPP